MTTLAGKTFRAVSNSTHGALNTETTMTFVAEDEAAVSGVYAGGTIKTGHVIARRTGAATAEMLYHCVTTAGELKAGQAQARFTADATQMHLDWQWLTGDHAAGQSEWVLMND
jgi:hypothetical protein